MTLNAIFKKAAANPGEAQLVPYPAGTDPMTLLTSQQQYMKEHSVVLSIATVRQDGKSFLSVTAGGDSS